MPLSRSLPAASSAPQLGLERKVRVPLGPSLFCHHNGTDFPPTLSLLLLLLIVVTVFLNDYFLKMFMFLTFISYVSNFYSRCFL